MANKANWRWQRTCAPGGVGTPSPDSHGRSRAGTPNPRSGRGQALRRNALRRHYERAGGPIVRNKANCSRATREAGTWLKENRDAWDTHMAAAKQSQWPHEQQAWARRRVGGASPTLRGRNQAGTANRRRGPPTVDRLRRTQSSRVTANTPREDPACERKPMDSRRSQWSGLQTLHFELSTDCLCVQTNPIGPGRGLAAPNKAN